MIFVVCRQVVHRKVSDYVSTKRVQKFHGLWCVPGTYTSDRQPCDKRGLTRTEFPTWPADTNAILSPFIVRITVSLIRNTRHYCSREKIGCDDGYNEHYIDFNKRFNEFRYRHSCFSSLWLIFSLSLSFFFSSIWYIFENCTFRMLNITTYKKYVRYNLTKFFEYHYKFIVTLAQVYEWVN